jgi:hypothetical protein
MGGGRLSHPALTTAPRAMGKSVTETAGTSEAGAAGDAGADSEAGAMSEGGAVDAAVACDPTGDPSTQPCALTAAVGVFVSAAASDANDGSKELPFATIGYAIAHLGAAPASLSSHGAAR